MFNLLLDPTGLPSTNSTAQQTCTTVLKNIIVSHDSTDVNVNFTHQILKKVRHRPLDVNRRFLADSQAIKVCLLRHDVHSSS